MKLLLAENLKMLMASRVLNRKPISANELSRRTKVPQSSITRILTSKTLEPGKATLDPLAKFFGVSVADLRGETDLKVLGSASKPAASGGETYSLAYVTMREMQLLSYHRSANEIGKMAIEESTKAIAKNAPAAATGANNVRRIR